ncbi:MAG: MFS transporter [Candidatus Pacearchaeota archaeon]
MKKRAQRAQRVETAKRAGARVTGVARAKQGAILFNIILLGIVSLITDFSSEIIKPILPAFLLSLGASSAVIGLVGGFIEGIPNLLKVFSGFISDKIKKYKPFVAFGYGFSAIFKALLAIAKVPLQAIAFISAERVGKGIREAPRDALVARYKERGYGFGIHRAFDTSGAVLGSIAAFILIFFGFSLRSMIALAGALAFLALIPIAFVREAKEARAKEEAIPKAKLRSLGIFSELSAFPKELKIFFVIAAIFALSNFSYMFFVLNAMKTIKTGWGNLGLGNLGSFGNLGSLGIPIALYVLFNIFYAAFSIPLGKLSDKIGRKKLLIFGYGIFSFICLLFIFSSSLAIFILGFALYGISLSAIEVSQRAYVADLARKKATALGAFYTLTGITTILSSLIAGFLWQISPAFTFFYGFALGLISTLLLFLLRARQQRH